MTSIFESVVFDESPIAGIVLPSSSLQRPRRWLLFLILMTKGLRALLLHAHAE